MKNKNKGRDNFITKMRSPYERVFSQTNHRTRYKGEVPPINWTLNFNNLGVQNDHQETKIHQSV